MLKNYLFFKFARDSQNTQTQAQAQKLKYSKKLKLKPKLKPLSIFDCICLFAPENTKILVIESSIVIN